LPIGTQSPKHSFSFLAGRATKALNQIAASFFRESRFLAYSVGGAGHSPGQHVFSLQFDAHTDFRFFVDRVKFVTMNAALFNASGFSMTLFLCPCAAPFAAMVLLENAVPVKPSYTKCATRPKGLSCLFFESVPRYHEFSLVFIRLSPPHRKSKTRMGSSMSEMKSPLCIAAFPYFGFISPSPLVGFPRAVDQADV